MAKKTWKLGEVCRGGIITVETKNNIIKVIGKEWDYSQGTNKGSNQSNAKEWTRLEVNAEVSDADRDLRLTQKFLMLIDNFQCLLTTLQLHTIRIIL